MADYKNALERRVKIIVCHQAYEIGLQTIK